MTTCIRILPLQIMSFFIWPEPMGKTISILSVLLLMSLYFYRTEIQPLAQCAIEESVSLRTITRSKRGLYLCLTALILDGTVYGTALVIIKKYGSYHK